jgi:hypothetical protein
MERMSPTDRAGLEQNYTLELNAKPGSNPNNDWLASNLPTYWIDTDPGASAYMQIDFDAATKQAYFMTGNLEAARRTALDQVNRVYGESRVNGQVEMMRYAPERFFGSPNLSVSDNARWIREQLTDVIKQNGLDAGIDTNTLRLTPYGMATNGRPQYGLTYTGEDGVTRALVGTNNMPKMYQPDWATSAEARRQTEKMQAANQSAMARANRIQSGQEAYGPGAASDIMLGGFGP